MNSEITSKTELNTKAYGHNVVWPSQTRSHELTEGSISNIESQQSLVKKSKKSRKQNTQSSRAKSIPIT